MDVLRSVEQTFEFVMHAIECLDRLDGARRQGLPHILDELMQMQQVNGDPELLLDLCCADLEWNWRNIDSERSSSGTTASRYGTEIEAYLEILSNHFSETSGIERFALIESRWMSESKWGDAPAIRTYQDRYDLTRQECEQLILRLNEIVPWGVQDDGFASQFAFRRICLGSLVIGRQRKDDPEPIALVSQNRLIIASRSETTISRQQLLVGRIALDKIRVKNMGKSTCKFAQDTKVRAGESAELPLPFCFAVSKAAIRICLDDGC